MLAHSLAPLALLITRQLQLGSELAPCLSYYGTSTTGKYSFYGSSDENCVFGAASLVDYGSVTAVVPQPATELIWLESEASAVDASLVLSQPSDVIDQFLASVEDSITSLQTEKQQHVLDGWKERIIELIHLDGSSRLLLVDSYTAHAIDSNLPPFWRSMRLSLEPQSAVPVPSNAVERVRDILKDVKFNPVVASVVNNISTSQLKKDIRYLTGEDSKSEIVSRHSFSDGALVAAEWLQARFEETGATCRLSPFLSGFAPNVICAYPSTVNTTETILLSAHYDSRGSFGSTRAPGGDDDGSGTVALLSIARTIARLGIKFKKNVELCAFAGEEQGLLGSRAYARELRENGANLTLMVQADMLAYHKNGEPPQLGLPDRIGTAEVTQLVANLSAIYSPELKVGFTPACCSDHQSFHEQGFPATQVFERAGPIADPMYHNSGDVSDREGYDFEQLKSIAKVQFATVLHAAGFEIPDDES